MLASITPFGERGKDNRWAVTVTAYVVGSVAGGLALGVLAGAVGAAVRVLLGDPSWWSTAALATLAVGAVVGLAFDLGLGGLALPANHRQVNERWLDRYRGVVYGAGFGAQLGFGLVTIVSGSIVYLTVLAAACSGSVLGGAIIGGVFGLVRALPQLGARRATSPSALRELLRDSQRRIAPFRTASLVVQGLVGAAALVLAVGGI